MDSAVAGLKAHQNKMDVIGNNIANVNTFGFKSQNYSFTEAMYQTSSASTGGVNNGDTNDSGGTNAAQYGYGTVMGTISTDMTASTPSYVGGLNACIDGEGFFITSSAPIDGATPDAIKDEDFQYTRVGQFSIDSEGYLVDGNGNYVYGFQPNNGDATATDFDTGTLVRLKAPDDGLAFTGDSVQLTSVTINSLGEVTATVKDPDGGNDGTHVSLGKIAIATFQNQNGLTKTGSGYYTASNSDNTGESAATVCGGSTASLMTGYLEGSNVDLATEFANMITTQRGFQANSKIITVSDEMLSDLINMKR